MKIDIGPFPDPGSNEKRHVEVTIHNYDAWNADNTLSLILCPLLREYRKQGASVGATDAEDFPGIGKPDNPYDEERWNHLIDELIWAFERIGADDDEAEKEQRPDGGGSRLDHALLMFGKYYRCLWN